MIFGYICRLSEKLGGGVIKILVTFLSTYYAPGTVLSILPVYYFICRPPQRSFLFYLILLSLGSSRFHLWLTIDIG